jgi:hypothetical protein
MGPWGHGAMAHGGMAATGQHSAVEYGARTEAERCGPGRRRLRASRPARGAHRARAIAHGGPRQRAGGQASRRADDSTAPPT